MPRLTVLALAFALALFPSTGLQDWWTSLWAEAGCGIDPGGRCAPAPSPDEGCGIDPSGAACPDRQ